MSNNNAPEEQPMRVFLSYSRKDRLFVDRLAQALTEQSCLPDYDIIESDNINTGISAEDQWWLRLKDMIAAANAIVFVVSPDSAKSPVCDEEIAYAQALGKRLIPILCRKIDFSTVPPRLSAYNVKIDFSDADDEKFNYALQNLVKVINRDVTWLRNITQLIIAAKNWDAVGRPDDQLLRGAEILKAEEVCASRPSTAAEHPELLLNYLNASRQAEFERQTISQVERARYLEFVKVMRPFLEEELRIRETLSESTHAAVAEEMRLEKELIRSLLTLDTKWHPEPAIFLGSTGARDGYAEMFKFPCCNLIVRDFLSQGEGDPPSQFRSDGCKEIPESIRYEYRPRANPFGSQLVKHYRLATATEDGQKGK